MGQQKIFQRVKGKYIRFGLTKIVNYILGLVPHAMPRRKQIHNPNANLSQYNAGVAFERMRIDFIGPFLKSNKGKNYMFLMIDHFS